MFHWRLLDHFVRDHSKPLKPEHLIYRCTTCLATFLQYKLFENHVYSAHSKKPSTSSVEGSGSRPSKPKDKVAVKKEVKKEPEDGLEQTNIVKIRASNLSRIVEAKQPMKEDSTEYLIPSTVLAGPRSKKSKKN